MSTTATDPAAGANSTTATAWARPRTTPDGDLMPGEDRASGESELGFWDMLDVINPLQHLPVVGTIYRAITGDTIGDAARMAGGALYGGPFGVVGALANLVVERETGQDIGDTALALLRGGPEAGGEADTAVADAGDTLPINAAPVTVAAAQASPEALAAQNAATAAAGTQSTLPQGNPSAQPDSLGERAVQATTAFQGRSADRLDAFIRQASAVRRDNPLPGAIDGTRLRAAVPATPDITAEKSGDGAKDADKTNDAELALAGGDAGSVSQWMLRALDKYEHMRRQEQS